jgi:hypothetical protein
MLKRTIDFHNLLILLNEPSNTFNQGFDVVNHNKKIEEKPNNKIMKCELIRWNSKLQNYKMKQQNKK